jgi:hypothetical protein
MRTILIVALAATGLCACATDSQMQQAAAVQCQSVGISQGDPQYDLCMRSYTLQANRTRSKSPTIVPSTRPMTGAWRIPGTVTDRYHLPG